jgi:hypothetical protein
MKDLLHLVKLESLFFWFHFIFLNASMSSCWHSLHFVVVKNSSFSHFTLCPLFLILDYEDVLIANNFLISWFFFLFLGVMTWPIQRVSHGGQYMIISRCDIANMKVWSGEQNMTISRGGSSVELDVCTMYLRYWKCCLPPIHFPFMGFSKQDIIKFPQHSLSLYVLKKFPSKYMDGGY